MKYLYDIIPLVYLDNDILIKSTQNKGHNSFFKFLADSNSINFMSNTMKSYVHTNYG